jgi:hypothetical protein
MSANTDEQGKGRNEIVAKANCCAPNNAINQSQLEEIKSSRLLEPAINGKLCGLLANRSFESRVSSFELIKTWIR